jgi:TonB dependent receptor/Carboxypeptidase regulatory-like domain/TonB-dependent Receptor Plug Domain
MYFRLRLTLSVFCVALFSSFAQAQTVKLTGKVLNEKNEALAGVSVKIVGGGGAATDIEGRFSLSLTPGKKYELEFSAIGYETKSITEVEVIAGQVNELNITLQVKAKAGDNVVITAKTSTARKETVNAAVAFQKNTNTVAQIISAETIRRSPDKNTGEVLKRITGLSIQDGRYLIVRGLADRYNQAMLNGILLSSTEPDRKTFSFDIFPAAVIDNITVNKAFVPEYPGEWAGGLIQVNTKDIPSSNYFNMQIGTGFNSNALGSDFYKSKNRGSLDFLGIADDTRKLPDEFPTKSVFAGLSQNDRNILGSKIPNNWAYEKTSSSPNFSLQTAGGFTGNLFHKKVGGAIALNYNRSIKHYEFKNAFYSGNFDGGPVSPDFNYSTDKYATEILWGGIANFSIQLDGNNKISVKNLFNINSSQYVSLRSGYEALSVQAPLLGREMAMRINTFYNVQVAGEHNLRSWKTKFNWYGSFNILDQYIPDQLRSEYLLNSTTQKYEARLSSGGSSQKSGSIFYSNLSDYIYTAGGDLTKAFTWGGRNQSVKGGYFLQVKDRLYDSKPFFTNLRNTNPGTNFLQQPEYLIFDQANYTNGLLNFDEFTDDIYRYLANSILNAGYLQFDNMLTTKLRAVWGLRVEDFDQLIGSVKQSDKRFAHTEVTDYLPALNLTYKINNKTNLRLAGSQTVVRPEFRELTSVAFYDFELGATILGNSNLERTKIINTDLRYEIYPRAGELITVGAFYKHFDKPIELYFNSSGAGSSNTFNYQNADQATSFGAEFEIRKKLDFAKALKNFTFTSNLAYIYNRVRFKNSTLADRPMQGQSPFTINFGLNYDLEKHGFNATLLFNEIGRRILFVNGLDVSAIWEAPRPLLDFQLAKKVLKNKGEIKLNISDIINKQANFYHDIDSDKKYGTTKDALAISKKYGTNFSITFGYNFK